jgi:hypothetical protein
VGHREQASNLTAEAVKLKIIVFQWFAQKALSHLLLRLVSDMGMDKTILLLLKHFFLCLNQIKSNE